MGLISIFVKHLIYTLQIHIPGLKIHAASSTSSISWEYSKHSKLHLSNNTTDAFLGALGLLNYVLLYIGARCGIKLESEATLKNIARICLEFGMKSEIEFDVELEDVVQDMSDYILL